MYFTWFSLCFLFYYELITGFPNAEKKPPEVTVSSGKVQGSWKTSYDGREYAAFEGIPYAEPPIEDLRFEAAKPMGKWSGIWQATKLYECIQFDFKSDVIGKEDCLYINIYVPKEANVSKKLDVVVHIHGGGFVFGSANTFVEPKYVMDRDIVLVTFNYRLSILGFISTGDEVAPGNNGLKDQILALRWVQENIAYFGGNPKSVTLTGFSAGASSVHLHYFSELSEGLFHRGMSISGVSFSKWTIKNNLPQTVKILGEIVGCPTNTSQTLIDCLKTGPASLLTLKVASQSRGVGKGFGPVIEKEGKSSFLTEHPYKMMMEGKLRDLPWITSVTADEGLYLSAFLPDMDNINKELTDILFLRDGTNNLDENDAINKIKKFYLGADKPFKTYKQFVKVLTDRYALIDAESAVRLQSTFSKSPVYFYYFNYNKGENMIKNPKATPPAFKGVSHGDDMIYFFGAMIEKRMSESDIRLKNLCLDMLYSYASTGVPVFKGVIWNPNDGGKISYLNITDAEDIKLEVKNHVSSSYELWKGLGLLEEDKFAIKRGHL